MAQVLGQELQATVPESQTASTAARRGTEREIAKKGAEPMISDPASAVAKQATR